MRRVLKGRTLSIKVQILMICILCLFIMQVILMVNYNQFKQMKIAANSKYFSDLIIQMKESVELNCTYLNGMVENIAYNDTVQKYLEEDEITYRSKHYEEVMNFMKPFADLNKGIKDIAIIDNNGKVLNINGDIDTILEVAEEIPENTLWYYTKLHNFKIYKVQYPLFSIGARVYSITDFTNKEKIGTVLISFNMDSIFGFGHNEKNSKLPDMLIFDRAQNLVYSSIDQTVISSYDNYFDENGNERTESVKADSKVYYIKTGTVETNGIKIVYLIPKEELLKGLDSIRTTTIIICVAVFGFMLFISILVTNNIVIPLKQFMTHINKLGDGDLRMIQQPIRLHGAAEITIMSQEFNQMMEEINDLNHRLVSTSSRLYEAELAKKQAELEYFYSQVNPHFLFNTLETIKGCAVEENADQTFHMINSLGKMFRYCVRGGNVVRVEEELNVINSYMYLQKIRFGSRLEFVCNVKEEMYSLVIPKMILQPLIENAVIHGIEEKDAIQVELKGRIEKDTVFFYVCDDGAGIEESKREELVNSLNQMDSTSSIGLKNVNKRLKYIYGEEFGLKIEDTSHRGFCVSIHLPCSKQSEFGDSNMA